MTFQVTLSSVLKAPFGYINSASKDKIVTTMTMLALMTSLLFSRKPFEPAQKQFLWDYSIKAHF